MSDIEDKIYKELTRYDEWAEGDKESLKAALFGTDEWASVRESEWINNYKDSHWECMGY